MMSVNVFVILETYFGIQEGYQIAIAYYRYSKSKVESKALPNYVYLP